MGLYDSVIFSCPACGARIEVQSKAGKSEMEDYIGEAPIVIATDIEGEEHRCDSCGKLWVVEAGWSLPSTVPVRLAEPWSRG